MHDVGWVCCWAAKVMTFVIFLSSSRRTSRITGVEAASDPSPYAEIGPDPAIMGKWPVFRGRTTATVGNHQPRRNVSDRQSFDFRIAHRSQCPPRSTVAAVRAAAGSAMVSPRPASHSSRRTSRSTSWPRREFGLVTSSLVTRCTSARCAGRSPLRCRRRALSVSAPAYYQRLASAPARPWRTSGPLGTLTACHRRATVAIYPNSSNGRW
jgi:hypothetical protein